MILVKISLIVIFITLEVFFLSTVTDLESYQKYAEEQQAANNAWSAEQAQKQMDFQERMSSTAHQREVADLKASGLNPVLSANSGAAVPNGASGDTDTSASGNVGAILQQVLQAQSAREVAGMYNAATMAAAQMAANASMYAADKAYQNQEDHPSSSEGVFARWLLGQGDAGGAGAAIYNTIKSLGPAGLGLLFGRSAGKATAAKAAGSAAGAAAAGAAGSSAFSITGLLRKAGAAAAGIGLGKFLYDSAQKIDPDVHKSPAAWLASGVLGNEKAARAYGQWQAARDANLSQWNRDVLPALKKAGYNFKTKDLLHLRELYISGNWEFFKRDLAELKRSTSRNFGSSYKSGSGYSGRHGAY